jgi:FkbM family methyltransferase
MATRQINRKPVLPYRLSKSSRYAIKDMMVIDIGASGGVDDFWEVFGSCLRAIGFDPLVAEVDRLNHAGHRGIRYEAAFVGCDNYDRLFPPDERQDRISSKDNFSFHETSAARAAEAMALNYTRDVYNSGSEVRLTNRHISLDAYVQQAHLRSVDFVKIDTDGHDLEVILGAREMLKSTGVLGLCVEAQMHGAVHPFSNTFANIDRVLREWGFSLFDLDLWRYSRRALPDQFYYAIPAQTVSGQIQWGEAVYFRDLASADYERMHGFTADLHQRTKLACLFELYGLPDCAAQILDLLRQETGDDFFSELLGELVHSYRGSSMRHSEFLKYFDADPRRFFP